MHELSLCRTIIDIINDRVERKKYTRVKKISLEIGSLAAIDESSLRFGFDVVAKGTIAEGAILDIIKIEAQAICGMCHKTVKLRHYYDACQNCGQFLSVVTQGEELRVKCMEVE